MHRQMRTDKVHYITDDYNVETQTGYVKGKRVYEIAVVNLNTAREEFRNVESVEKAIRLCDRKQEELNKKKAELATERKAAAKEKEENTNPEPRGPFATSRQVDYIMSLLSQHGGQNVTWYSAGPTTLAEVKLMTRSDASTYISALKNES
ncbi:hypothetical protein [Corynebacterium accolens]|uniref:hypothetical protein n=1 Tax=Corynebacterium accolens TaxID=38284 RepID=UPI00254CD75C|nr:hypothetical protein [Corynebacterium accolens]MDK8469830.1 hypothetical protein [Corynebacterium accolens]